MIDGYGGQLVALLVRHGSLAVLCLGVVHGGDAVEGTPYGNIVAHFLRLHHEHQ